MFRRLGIEQGTLDDLCRVEALVRDRFEVRDSDLILVSQDPGARPGFPPLETNVVFWKNETRYKLKVFAPVADVNASNIPLRWLLPALEDTGENECC